MKTNPSSDIAFTPAVKAAQTRHGSRTAYAALESKGGFRVAIDMRMREALAQANSAYLVTANADGQPYAQHRGGPKGFIRVIDDRTIGFADYTGNQQYISTGNLADNPKAFLFLMDYAHRRRVKIWGRARVVEGDAALNAQSTVRSTFRRSSMPPMSRRHSLSAMLEFPNWRLSSRPSPISVPRVSDWFGSFNA